MIERKNYPTLNVQVQSRFVIQPLKGKNDGKNIGTWCGTKTAGGKERADFNHFMY